MSLKAYRNTSNPHLEFKNVSFHYGATDKKEVFQEVNVRVDKGEFVSILGPSGAGKSTFFRMATGLVNPQSGEILINDKKEENRLGKIGYMPQKDSLLPWRTVLENGVLPLEIKGVPKNKARKQVKSYLQAFGLSGTENQYPSKLSGGMRQRVSFLRAMLGGNDILLLDEPFSALDSITRFMMQEWLLELWQTWQKTLIFITHDVEEALFLSDRILILTEPPVKDVMEEVVVPLGRPRSEEVLSEPTFMALKKDLLRRLKSKVNE